MRKFILWFFSIAIAMVFLAIAAYLLAKRFEEPVRNYIVKQVNARLEAPVHVSDINFSFLERFPSASLVMDDVWAEENIIKMGDPDTLFYFRKVYLNLNVFALLNGEYRINEIEVRDGFMRLLVDESGYDNYRIWKTSEDTTGFLLELDKVHLENTHLQFNNELRHQYYDITAQDLYFKGSFSDESYTMAVYGTGKVHDLKVKETSYLIERKVLIETDLDIQTADDRYSFRKGLLTIDDLLDFQVSGSFVNDGVDLRIRGKELDIIRTLALIPSESRAALDDYQSSGEVSFDCTLKGAFSRDSNPSLNATFTLKDGAISKRGEAWKLTDLNGQGKLINGAQRNYRSTELVLEHLTGALNDGPFTTQFSLSDLEHPSIKGRAQLQTDLEALQALVQFEGIEEMSGALTIDAQLEAKMEDPSQPKVEDFINSKASGSIFVKSAKIKRVGDERRYEVDSAAFDLAEDDLVIRSYQGRLNDCEVSLEGRADGFLAYLFTKDARLDMVGKVQVGDVNLNELFPSSSNSSSGVVVAFPTRTTWDLEIEARQFHLQQFDATNIQGRLVMTPFKVEGKQLRFESQAGTVGGSIGIYRFSEDQLGLRTNFMLRDIDMKQLFTTFNNFDQNFITGDVLEGKLVADVSFQALCDSTLQIDLTSMVATADIKVREGALTGFEPLISVADEIKQKPVLRLFVKTDLLKERLQDIRFATLENVISIRNSMVTIPQMEIRSSALNINLSGTHGFDNRIDYNLDFALTDVLKLEGADKASNEFVTDDEEGKTRIFLRMHGTTDDFEVELKRTDLKEQVKKDIQREKETIKAIIDQEFRRDSANGASFNPDKKEDLEIEFDPEGGDVNKELPQDPVKDSELKKTNQNDEKNVFQKLMKKTETDKKKLREGDFEDDDF